MLKNWFLLILVISGFSALAQECPRITNPVNGAIEVPVNTTISWPKIDGIVGYLISLGTTPGGTDLLNRRSAGLTNFFTPEVGLPADTIIYVTIEMFLPGQQIKICPGESFRTIAVTQAPPCTRLLNPVANSTNVPVNDIIKWTYAPTATGYRINIGTSSGATDLANNLDVGNVLSFNPPNDFMLDQELFVRLTPYNENGDAVSCAEESFTTGIPIIDCEALVNPATGGIYSIRPQIKLPERIGLCPGELTKEYVSLDNAQGFRWFRLNEDGSETLISNTNQVSFDGIGRYRYEAFNTTVQSGSTIECEAVKEFDVFISAPPRITGVDITREANGLDIIVRIEGSGNYEFALDDVNGQFQDSNFFSGIALGEHIVFVRDKDGCGTINRVVERSLSAKDFPQFFTPNGDGIHDYWQFKAPVDVEVNIEVIRIYDRYGNFIAQINPEKEGWDGSFNGQELPAADYWFRAVSIGQQVVSGHFTLKR